MGDRMCSPTDEWMPPPPPPPLPLKATIRLVQADDISYPPSENCPVHSPHRLRLANGTPFRVYNTSPRPNVICHHYCHHHHHQPQRARVCTLSNQVYSMMPMLLPL